MDIVRSRMKTEPNGNFSINPLDYYEKYLYIFNGSYSGNTSALAMETIKSSQRDIQ